jgi:hypothetical protein
MFGHAVRCSCRAAIKLSQANEKLERSPAQVKGADIQAARDELCQLQDRLLVLGECCA